MIHWVELMQYLVSKAEDHSLARTHRKVTAEDPRVSDGNRLQVAWSINLPSNDRTIIVSIVGYIMKHIPG